jgi:lipid A 3-O-deacylase
MRSAWLGLAAVGALAAAADAEASVTSVHGGVVAHNIKVIDDKNAEKESSAIAELQVNFDSPAFLRWLAAPEPFVVAAPNLGGETSFVAAGLEWRFHLGERWAVEPALGYALHDGEIDDPYPGGSPEAAQFQADHVLYGSRDLFRVTVGVSRELAGGWEAQVLATHYSHGQILGHGRNQGVDQVGVRIGKSFGG